MDLAAPRRTLRLLAAASLATAALFAGGCYFPGGSMQSGGASTYESTPYFPMTITIRNTVTQEDIWTCDVPVGQQLVIWFNPNERENDALLPDTMDWDLMAAGTRYGGLDNSLPVPSASCRAVIVTKRKGPESPAPVSAEAGQHSDEGM
jgi:hypothetical protein